MVKIVTVETTIAIEAHYRWNVYFLLRKDTTLSNLSFFFAVPSIHLVDGFIKY